MLPPFMCIAFHSDAKASQLIIIGFVPLCVCV